MLKGIAASAGIAAAKAYKLEQPVVVIEKLEGCNADEEIAKLKKALEKTVKEPPNVCLKKNCRFLMPI